MQVLEWSATQQLLPKAGRFHSAADWRATVNKRMGAVHQVRPFLQDLLQGIAASDSPQVQHGSFSLAPGAFESVLHPAAQKYKTAFRPVDHQTISQSSDCFKFIGVMHDRMPQWISKWSSSALCLQLSHSPANLYGRPQQCSLTVFGICREWPQPFTLLRAWETSHRRSFCKARQVNQPSAASLPCSYTVSWTDKAEQVVIS